MINEAGLKLIKEFEGLVLTAYPDPGSKNGLPWTIGYGHTKGVKKGDKITATKAEEFLIEEYGSDVLDFLREKSKEIKIFYKDDYIEIINKFKNNE